MQSQLDILWVLIATVLVLLMQGGFLALESGLTRTKNAINVAMKNIADLTVSLLIFWFIGFALMFGDDINHLISLADGDIAGSVKTWSIVFFLFQVMFCATASTIVSGAIAERTKFWAYIFITVLITGLIYPIFGHWAWSGLYSETPGWLESRGFIDFAGSTVVHSIGGWVALACVIHIGPRKGRFTNSKVNEIPASNIPIAMLGVMLFFVGWIGFNGGSTLEFNDQVPGIILNTILAGVAGCFTAMLTAKFLSPNLPSSIAPLNGAIAGLVAITASCHIVTGNEALLIGSIGALFMLLCDRLLTHFQIDDAVGAIPVHLAAGIWGTLAVALFGDLSSTGNNLNLFNQLIVQIEGIVVCGLWAFGVAYIVLNIVSPYKPLRIDSDDEDLGLNVAEHGAKSALYELLETIENHQSTQNFTQRAEVEPFTEIGQIATHYNRLLDILDNVNERTKRIVSDIKDGIITFNKHGNLLSVNPGAERLMAVSGNDVIGQPLCDVLAHSGFISQKFDWNIAITDQHKKQELMQKRQIIGPGDKKGHGYFEISTTESMDTDGSFYTSIIRDITEQRRLEELLIKQKELAQITLESLGEGVLTIDRDGKVTYMNPIAESILGAQLINLKGKPVDSVLKLFNDMNNDKIELGELQKRGELTAITRYNTISLKSDYNKSFVINLTAAPIWNRSASILGSGDILGSVIVFQDVSKARELERQLSYQATHDTITGLLNRGEFERRLQELILECHTDETEHVMCYVDLDQFKIVNDTCGHNAGDELLRQLGSLLTQNMRSADTFARLGGDEFGVLLKSCDLSQGESIANEIRESIDAFRFSWDGAIFSIGASIGIVSISHHSESSIEVMSQADAACYVAKDSGRNRVHIHQIHDTELVRQRGHMHWASRIQQAIDEDRLRLYYQPIVPANSTSAREVHYEIFVRMIDELGDIISPGSFIPAAERYHFMTTIDEWVVENTLSSISNRPEPIRCAINLSGASINNHKFIKFLKQQLRKPGVHPECICFEITETAAISNISSARKFIQELRALGCQFSLDDFGSGLSSFGYLKSLPVDFLKIDGQFVRDMLKDEIDHAMVKSISEVGHIIGLEIIAEYVESEDIADELARLGIDYLQGYHSGKPKPLEEFENVMHWPR